MSITPIFFPFTFMTEEHFKAASAIFPSIKYLAVEREVPANENREDVFQNEVLQPILPTDREIEAVEHAASSYLNWADMHKGNERNLKALLNESAYFTDDTHVSSIKSQLLRGGQEETAAKGEPEWLQNLLFLRLSQLCDAQHDSIDEELRELEKNKQELFTELRGLDNSIETDSPPDESDTHYRMIRERIVCWTRYMAKKEVMTNEENVPVLITVSDSVYDWFETNCDLEINPLDIQKLKVHENKCKNRKQWQKRFSEYLMHAIEDKEIRKQDVPEIIDDCSNCARLKLGFFSGSNINFLFKRPVKQIPVCLVKIK